MMVKKIACVLITGILYYTAYAKNIIIKPSMNISEIQKFIEILNGGDTLFLAPGTYPVNIRLKNVNGNFNSPVVISGLNDNSNHRPVFICSSPPSVKANNYAFHLINSSWIEIRNINLQNYYLDAIKAEGSSYITISSCKITGSKRVLFAVGRASHHFVVENCIWEQDERVATHAEDYSWEEVHHGKYSYFNGSIFQGYKISGSFVIRGNTIKNTFNAFRLSQIKSGKIDSLACTNGEIYNNTIINTADNVLEPELFCYNLHFHHNKIINGHAFISITEVGGGYLYIYGNTGVSMPESEDGWTIYKISKGERPLSLPSWFFNNSWYIDFDVLGSPRNDWRNDNIIHFNNAYYIEKIDSFGVYQVGENNQYDYDCSNKYYPAWFKAKGFEKNGLVADPGFRDPFKNDFTLSENSPCLDAGMMDPALIPYYEGNGPDIGAYDNNKPVFGLPFTYMIPLLDVPYIEPPRITRYKIIGSKLILWFSIPMDINELNRVELAIKTNSGTIPLQFEKEISSPGKAVYSLNGPCPEIECLLFSSWPVSLSGMPLTIWASELKVSLRKP